MAVLTCLIFSARKCNGERSEATFVWAQLPESNRAWYYASPTNDPEEDVEYLPLGIVQRLPAAHHPSDDVFAYRLVIAQVDEEELERNWTAAPPLAVVFREPRMSVIGMEFRTQRWHNTQK